MARTGMNLGRPFTDSLCQRAGETEPTAGDFRRHDPQGDTPSRRWLLRAGGLGVAVAGTGAVIGSPRQDPTVPLYMSTVARSSSKSLVAVAAGQENRVIPGSRVLHAAEDAHTLFRRQQQWVSSERPWVRENPFPNLTRSALLDICVLFDGFPAPLAGWAPLWRHVWPRDACHVAVGLAAAGLARHTDSVFTFLSRVQRVDGRFEARYLPDGSGVPDDRPVQLDGTGWVPWALDAVAQRLPAADQAQFIAAHGPMVRRCVHTIVQETDTRTGLPAPCPDYWERPEREITLGTAAPLLAGLRAAASLLRVIGEDELATVAGTRAKALAEAIITAFGPAGYPRYPSGRGRDTAVAFLLPPYAPTTEPLVLKAFHQAQDEMLRPAGGLAPGAQWRDDGISWTPHTASFALAHALTGQRAQAERLLRWLDT
ncbi:MAG: hypothetical protein CSB46_07700, partial [Micrococcales bacterium]